MENIGSYTAYPVKGPASLDFGQGLYAASSTNKGILV